uniref:Putative aldo/keto reductase n=1 Tax=Sphaerisporangium sp. SANK 60911 TaxID=1354075 RepID=V5YRK0_9ACTN|nr:putative aldo/keto reductase [Sphaerisporangium sp. SANK 60911]
MRTAPLAGVPVSAIGLGTTTFGKHCDEAEATAAVHAALDHGITFFDTADSYGAGRRGVAETILGRALGGRRAEVAIATKFGTEYDGLPASAGADRARSALEGSLRRLGTDHVDIYLLHVPDPRVPIEETLGAMEELVRAGKARAIGCSNLTVPQLKAADAPGFACVQDEYNLLARGAEAELLPYCAETGKGFVAYAPLAGGLLSGKYGGARPTIPPGSRMDRIGAGKAAAILTPATAARSAAYVALCHELGLPPAQVALAWLLSKAAVTSVIPGATGPDQVRRNAAAASLRLDRDVIERIEVCASGAEQGDEDR